jgi:hypothetical protein
MFKTTVAVTTGLLLTCTSARAEIIDRILAVVNGQIITLSDAQAALRFGLVPPDVSDDPVGVVLQRLIDRRLMLAEVDRYAPPEPPIAAVDAAVAKIRAKFKDALEFETILTRHGLLSEELRRYLRDSLRLESYLEQRYAALPQPSDSELETYYRDRASEFTVPGQPPRALEDVKDRVKTRFVADQRERFVRDWLEGLRRRAAIVTLQLPGR